MRLPLISLLLAGSAFADGWTFDAARSELVVKVWKTGAAAGLAHDHVIRATKVSGTAKLDDDGALTSLALQLNVDVSSLVPDEPEVRTRYGVTGPAVPDSDRQKVKENMLGAEQLDARRFPTLGFSLISLDADGARGRGTLTLHGVSRTVEFPVVLKRTERELTGEARLTLKTSDYGVAPYSAALGLIKNKDEVELQVRVVLTRSESTSKP